MEHGGNCHSPECSKEHSTSSHLGFIVTRGRFDFLSLQKTAQTRAPHPGLNWCKACEQLLPQELRSSWSWSSTGFWQYKILQLNLQRVFPPEFGLNAYSQSWESFPRTHFLHCSLFRLCRNIHWLRDSNGCVARHHCRRGQYCDMSASLPGTWTGTETPGEIRPGEKRTDVLVNSVALSIFTN